jgi:LPS-assembly protein
VANVDYLSSFVFRIAFSQFFNQAVLSEVKSQMFLSKTTNGFFYNALAERYQNFESTTAGDVITILHTPNFEFSSVDHRLGHSPFYGNFAAAADGLSRSEPSFRTPHLVGRFDVNPSVSLPLLVRGWSLRPEVGMRDTLYSQQRVPLSGVGVASRDPINRKALESSVELRPPALERIFGREILGRKLKHVVEPRVVYRRVVGVDNFSRILRFDEHDVLSDTNEVEYGVVNRLFAKRHSSKAENCNTVSLSPSDRPSPSPLLLPPWEPSDTQPQPQPQPLSRPWEENGPPPKTGNCPAQSPVHDLVDWELAQKYFLDTNFGGALVNGSRNVFTTTADFAGIAFLTSPRHLSPLISRLRIQPGSTIDAEWDLDYDFTSGKINASTAVLNYHIRQFSFGGGDAFLQAPAENSASNGVAQLSRFHQFRMQLGYGRSNKRGLSGAANFGYDAIQGLLQYSAVQATYNWDCCGITAEYRRFALGSVRNDHQYLFTYSLANVGSFGNLLRSQRLY